MVQTTFRWLTVRRLQSLAFSFFAELLPDASIRVVETDGAGRESQHALMWRFWLLLFTIAAVQRQWMTLSFFSIRKCPFISLFQVWMEGFRAQGYDRNRIDAKACRIYPEIQMA